MTIFFVHFKDISVYVKKQAQSLFFSTNFQIVTDHNVSLYVLKMLMVFLSTCHFAD